MSSELIPQESDAWTHLLLRARFGVNEIETKLNILNEEYQFFHSYNPIEHITTRIKAPREIVRKLQRQGHEPTLENAEKYVHDIGGVRIICSFTKDVYTIAQLLQNQSDIKVKQIKDYIKNPKPNGYRSYHMLVEIPVFLSDHVQPVTVEVQLRTTGMDLWASIEHKIYYKSDAAVPDSVLDRLKQCAQVLSILDSEMTSIKADIEKHVK